MPVASAPTWNMFSPSPSSPRKNDTMANASLGLDLHKLLNIAILSRVGVGYDGSEGHLDA